MAGLAAGLVDRSMSNVIEAHDLTKVYKMGEVEVQALRGVSFNIQARRSDCHHGPFRFRQDHADEHARMSG